MPRTTLPDRPRGGYGASVSGNQTRYAIDAPTALRVIREDAAIGERHALVGPAALRSDVLAAIYGEVRRGELDRRTARAELDALAALKIRLLGDRVSRLTAFRLALELETDDIGPLEYLAVARLQADVLVAADDRLAQLAQGIVPVVPFEELQR